MHTNIIWSIKTRFVLNLNEHIILALCFFAISFSRDTILLSEELLNSKINSKIIERVKIDTLTHKYMTADFPDLVEALQ
jgi:hypothetical protein